MDVENGIYLSWEFMCNNSINYLTQGQQSHCKHLTKTKEKTKKTCQWSASIHRSHTWLAKNVLPNFAAGVFAPLDCHCTTGGPLLSGVKDYSCFSYKTWSRPVVSGNIKDLFTCRKVTETFISVNQQIVPFSNGPLGKHGKDRSRSTLPHCPVSGRKSIWFMSLANTQLVARDLPLSENGPQYFYYMLHN